jgi:hypothetical protein
VRASGIGEVLAGDHDGDESRTSRVRAGRDAYVVGRDLTIVNIINRRKPIGHGDLSLTDVADKLAMSIQKQWVIEDGIRRLNDPYPLPVSWVPADESLGTEWDVLVKLATEGAGSTSRSPSPSWATGPAGLAGSRRDLVDTLARVPTGRLVVLGEPGAGKTMLMIRLVLDLVDPHRRANGGAVPALIPLASWDPAERGLAAHIVAHLIKEHPPLKDAAPLGTGDGNAAEALLASGLIIPVLDGLDELPDSARITAINRINDGARLGQPLVLSCRTDQYRATASPDSGLGLAVRGAAVVELCPLRAGIAAAYLRDGVPTSTAAARWQPVLASGIQLYRRFMAGEFAAFR